KAEEAPGHECAGALKPPEAAPGPKASSEATSNSEASVSLWNARSACEQGLAIRGECHGPLHRAVAEPQRAKPGYRAGRQRIAVAVGAGGLAIQRRRFPLPVGGKRQARNLGPGQQEQGREAANSPRHAHAPFQPYEGGSHKRRKGASVRTPPGGGWLQDRRLSGGRP